MAGQCAWWHFLEQDCPQPPISSQMVTLGDSFCPCTSAPFYPFLDHTPLLSSIPPNMIIQDTFIEGYVTVHCSQALFNLFSSLLPAIHEGPGWPSGAFEDVQTKETKQSRKICLGVLVLAPSFSPNESRDIGRVGVGAGYGTCPAGSFPHLTVVQCVYLFYLMAKIPGGDRGQ